MRETLDKVFSSKKFGTSGAHKIGLPLCVTASGINAKPPSLDFSQNVLFRSTMSVSGDPKNLCYTLLMKADIAGEVITQPLPLQSKTGVRRQVLD